FLPQPLDSVSRGAERARFDKGRCHESIRRRLHQIGRRKTPSWRAIFKWESAAAASAGLSVCILQPLCLSSQLCPLHFAVHTRSRLA
ncbi:hypothetical protein U9M48_022672, partial [Paspalum notatum var. saurae]